MQKLLLCLTVLQRVCIAVWVKPCNDVERVVVNLLFYVKVRSSDEFVSCKSDKIKSNIWLWHTVMKQLLPNMQLNWKVWKFNWLMEFFKLMAPDVQMCESLLSAALQINIALKHVFILMCFCALHQCVRLCFMQQKHIKGVRLCSLLLQASLSKI